MRTMTLKSVMDNVGRRLGWHPESSDGLTNGQRDLIAAAVNERAREGWERTFWPELWRVELRPVVTDAVSGQRYVEMEPAAWDETATYAEDACVERLGIFYRAEQETTGDEPEDDDGTYWTAQEWKAIGHVPPMGVTTNHPQGTGTRTTWSFEVMGGKIVLLGLDVPAEVWVSFRERFEEVSATAWDQSRGYVAGDRVYSGTTGRSYRAIQATTGDDPATDDGSNWLECELPVWLRGFVCWGAAADLLAGDDGDEKSFRWDGLAEQKLGQAILQETAGQGQVMTAEWRE